MDRDRDGSMILTPPCVRPARYMLMFRHKEAIDLYTVQTEETSDGIKFLHRSLEYKKIVNKFMWFQW